jgi:predicted porin
MKKSLVALAALAATSAFAQSSVSITGNVDAGYQSIDYKGNKVNGINQNGSSTTGFRFTGTEDLGGGLKANFIIGTDFNIVSRNANTGTASVIATPVNSTAGTFGNGELSLGLSGGFGALTMGHLAFNTLTTFSTGQPFGTAIGGGYASVTRVNAAGTLVRDDNAVRYMTPTMNGFTGSLYKSYKQTKATGTDFSATFGAYDKLGSDEVGINYANGPIAASYSSLKQDSVSVGSGTTENTVNTLGANYTMGAAKLFVLNQTNKTTTGTVATDTKFSSVSATYTMGATTLMIQSGSLKQSAGANAGKKSDLTGIGADYALSKRTTAYLRNESIDDKAGVIAAAATIDGTGTKRTRTAIGVRHTF